jgi:hypothetical protein
MPDTPSEPSNQWYFIENASSLPSARQRPSGVLRHIPPGNIFHAGNPCRLGDWMGTASGRMQNEKVGLSPAVLLSGGLVMYALLARRRFMPVLARLFLPEFFKNFALFQGSKQRMTLLDDLALGGSYAMELGLDGVLEALQIGIIEQDVISAEAFLLHPIQVAHALAEGMFRITQSGLLNRQYLTSLGKLHLQGILGVSTLVEQGL